VRRTVLAQVEEFTLAYLAARLPAPAANSSRKCWPGWRRLARSGWLAGVAVRGGWLIR